MQSRPTETPFWQAALPVSSLLLIIVYGLIIRPQVLGEPAFPLEIVFISAAIYTVAQLLLTGHDWKAIMAGIVDKLANAMPILLILFSIGTIIGSWMISGTIPMLVYYGIKMISPTYIYLVAFLVPIIFSTLTGTSWGSVGTIGVVIIGVAGAIEADLGIAAGAIIGGAYFGDKLSPLSDTTNVASLAAGVDLYAHIRSMMYTTLSSAILAAIIFLGCGFVYPPASSNAGIDQVLPTLEGIASVFNFSIFLLIPPLIVLYGSISKKATIPTLISSTLSAAILALMIQPFTLTDVIQSVYKGFHTDMAIWVNNVPIHLQALFNRGGLYELSEAIIIALMVFVYIGTIDHINAMPILVNRLFGFAKKRGSVILSSLLATGITISMTSNQFATSFVVGDAFKSAYDRLNISRKVLSRSLEDYGTMLESLVPWTTCTVFMVETLNVPFADYWHWQLLSIINLIIAPLFVLLGIGLFDEEG